jgi:hypothetical protein
MTIVPIPVDPQWKAVANKLAGALRRYTMVHEQRVEDGKVICELRIPNEVHAQACRALDDLADLVYEDSHRQAELLAKKKAKAKATRRANKKRARAA